MGVGSACTLYGPLHHWMRWPVTLTLEILLGACFINLTRGPCFLPYSPLYSMAGRAMWWKAWHSLLTPPKSPLDKQTTSFTSTRLERNGEVLNISSLYGWCHACKKQEQNSTSFSILPGQQAALEMHNVFFTPRIFALVFSQISLYTSPHFPFKSFLTQPWTQVPCVSLVRLSCFVEQHKGSSSTTCHICAVDVCQLELQRSSR